MRRKPEPGASHGSEVGPVIGSFSKGTRSREAEHAPMGGWRTVWATPALRRHPVKCVRLQASSLCYTQFAVLSGRAFSLSKWKEPENSVNNTRNV